MNRLKTVLQPLALIYGSALVTAFFSEMFFFNEGPAYSIIGLLGLPLTLFLYLIELGFWYSLVTAPLLWTMYYFNVRSVWALFLVGCLFGLFTEGLIIPALYFELPFSLLWVAASWHALVCFLFGWYYVRRLFQVQNHLKTIATMVVLGLFWGVWPTIYIGQVVDQTAFGDVITVGETFGPIPIDQFFWFTFVTTVVLMLGNLLLNTGAGKPYQPGKIQSSSILLVSFLLLLVQGLTVSYLVFAMVLPALAIYAALNRNRKTETSLNVFNTFKPIPGWHYSFFFILPVVASGVYFTVTQFGLLLEPFWVAVPLCLTGLVMLAFSFYKIFGQKREI